MAGRGWGNGLIGGTDYDFGGSNTQSGSGGFGGGGAGGQHSQTGYGGGGGGYSGGGGGSWASPGGTGGGGGSYINSSNLSVSYNTHSGSHGEVEITFLSSSLYHFSSHTFTNCGATGRNGPTLANCISEYYSASWASNTDLFNMTTQGIQEWTVPESGRYKIKAWGADADNRTGGRGGIIEATFTLNKGEVIKILCGQRPSPYTNGNGSGAGGTFVVRSPYTNIGSVLIVAGGGGGGHNYSLVTGEKHGGFYGSGQGGTGTTGLTGGTNGGAGATGAGASGAGFLISGASSYSQLAAPKSFVNGGVGGSTTIGSTTYNGGFGGGGAHGNSHGAGGGGYSGGGGSSSHPYQGGGGGSISFNGVDVTTWTGATNGWVGEGKVEISLL